MDNKEILKWTKLFAESGCSEDEYELCLIYYKGEKTAKNYKEAVKRFRKLAEKGNVEAQFNLGNLYLHGTGVQKYLGEAYIWFSLSRY